MLKHVNPPCPRGCGGLLVSREDDDETLVADGSLRCSGCGRYSSATDEMQSAARNADAAWYADIPPVTPVRPPPDTSTLLLACIEAVVDFKR